MREVAAFVPNTLVLLDTRYLNAEQQEEEAPEWKRFECFVCDKRFTLRSTQQAHMRTHVEEDFACPVEGCGRVYRRQKSMLRHRRMMHEGAFRCQCPQPNCGQWCWSPKHLTRHQRVAHEERRPVAYQCPLRDCARRFQMLRNLGIHMRDAHRMLLPDPMPPRMIVEEEPPTVQATTREASSDVQPMASVSMSSSVQPSASAAATNGQLTTGAASSGDQLPQNEVVVAHSL